MPDDPSARRRRLSREAYAEQFARGDSYGLLLALLVVLYLLIAVEQHDNLWGRFFISVVLGGVLLLAFHTSHVRQRAFKVGIVMVVLADLANLLQAAFGRHGSDGSTFIMFLLVLAAPVVILNRIIRHETVGLETIPAQHFQNFPMEMAGSLVSALPPNWRRSMLITRCSATANCFAILPAAASSCRCRWP